MKRKALSIVLHQKRTLLIGLAVVLLSFAVLTQVVGIKAYSMVSGSMEPEIPTGSLVVVCPADPSLLQVGDVIAFGSSQDAVVTHRIVEVLDDPRSFRTKGDTNSFVDPVAIVPEKVQGKVFACIPFLGYVSVLLKSPVGLITLAAIAIPWLLAAFLPRALLGEGVKKQRL